MFNDNKLFKKFHKAGFKTYTNQKYETTNTSSTMANIGSPQLLYKATVAEHPYLFLEWKWGAQNNGVVWANDRERKI